MPDYAEALAYRAYAYQKMGKYQEALQDASQSSKIDPTYYLPRYIMSIVYIATNDYHDAIKELTECDKLSPM